jgi:PST family polysaccharide transporter
VIGRPKNTALLGSVFSGLGNQYASALSTGLGQLVVTATLARLLSPADYGLFGLAAVYTGLATIFSQFGVAAALVQRAELTPRFIRAGFTVTVLTGVLTTALVWSTAPLAASLLGSTELIPIIRGLSLVFVIANPGFVAEGLSQRKLAWRRLMWVEVSAFFLGNAFLAIGLALAGYGVWSLVASALAQSFVRTVALLALEPHPKWPRVGPEIREILRFGSGFTLARVFNYGAAQGDNLIVGRVLGIVALGYYSRAFKLMTILVTYFAAVVTRVLFPIMSRLQDDRERLQSTYLTGAAVLGLVSAPLGAILVVLAPEFILVVLGPKWIPATATFQILTAGIMLRNVYLMAYCLDGALGALRRRTLRDGIYALAVLLGSLIGARFGIVGVATGVIIAIALNYLVGAAMSLNLLKASWRQYAASQIPAILLGILTAVVAYSVRWGLLEAGANPLVVLGVTGAASLAVVGGLCLLQPSVMGPYGEMAARHFVVALRARLATNRAQ